MSWSYNGWINYSGQKSVQSAPPLHCVPLPGQTVPGASLQPQVWTPASVDQEHATRDALTRDQARRAGVQIRLTASGELEESLSTDNDPYFQNYYDLIKPYGRYPKDQTELDAWGVSAGLDAQQRMLMATLYDARAKKAAEAMTFQPTIQTKKKQDEQGMTFQHGVTMSKKKAADAVQARAQVARDIQATLAQVRAFSSGAAPTAALRTPVRPQRSGLDMVAAARLMMAFMQAQGDTSLREEIAAAKREIQVQVQRIEADRAARRLTGRA